ncbi:Hypothetical protein A7982_04768 [Minicystis rosea]|nr:Hypothetical protein A7982_04768 [Minicystis rosea]
MLLATASMRAGSNEDQTFERGRYRPASSRATRPPARWGGGAGGRGDRRRRRCS